jgi:cell division protein FtsI/penicillin-binding protein 2
MTPRILASKPNHLEMNLELGKRELEVIREGLRAVVDDERGTARVIRDSMFSIGGKTGTAQVAKGYDQSFPMSRTYPTGSGTMPGSSGSRRWTTPRSWS